MKGTQTWEVRNHFSRSEIRLWKLTQARCYQPVSICTDFHHQDFSTDRCGHAGVKRRKLRMWMRTDVLQSLTLCRPSLLRWGTLYTCSFFRPQICRLLISWFEENWMYTILLPPSTQFPLWESTNFPKIQVYQVSHVDVHHVLGGLVTSSPFDKNAWQWTWKTGRLETNRCEVCY